jgi:DNA polymerase-1
MSSSSSPAAEQHSLFMLIDGHALIYRAYHAFPGLSTSQGVLVNAVYGFTRILLTAIRDFRPEYIAVTFDHPKPTFRHEAFVEYKANRVEMPDDLKPQIEIVKEVVGALNIPKFELPGYEADDLIGTLTLQAKSTQTPAGRAVHSLIVTGDRDAFQLVDETTHVWMPGRGKGSVDTEYDAVGVKVKMGVAPEGIIEIKALMGDSSDNIPGVKGIGEKGAVKLIQTFGTVEKIYEVLENGQLSDEEAAVLKGALREKLIAGKAEAFMSRQLATIDRHVPIELNLDACRVSEYDKEKATELFHQFDFKSLVSLLPQDEFELGVQDALF